MDFSLVAWGLLGFLVPSLGTAALTAAFAKALWRRELQGVGWGRLTLISALGGALVSVAGLVGFGHDGMIETYAAMVVVCATLVWWVGFGR